MHAISERSDPRPSDDAQTSEIHFGNNSSACDACTTVSRRCAPKCIMKISYPESKAVELGTETARITAQMGVISTTNDY